MFSGAAAKMDNAAHDPFEKITALVAGDVERKEIDLIHASGGVQRWRRVPRSAHSHHDIIEGAGLL